MLSLWTSNFAAALKGREYLQQAPLEWKCKLMSRAWWLNCCWSYLETSFIYILCVCGKGGTQNSSLSSFVLQSYSASNQKVEKGRHKDSQSHCTENLFIILIWWPVRWSSVQKPVGCLMINILLCQCMLKQEMWFYSVPENTLLLPPFPFWPHTNSACKK